MLELCCPRNCVNEMLMSYTPNLEYYISPVKRIVKMSSCKDLWPEFQYNVIKLPFIWHGQSPWLVSDMKVITLLGPKGKTRLNNRKISKVFLSYHFLFEKKKSLSDRVKNSWLKRFLDRLDQDLNLSTHQKLIRTKNVNQNFNLDFRAINGEVHLNSKDRYQVKSTF